MLLRQMGLEFVLATKSLSPSRTSYNRTMDKFFGSVQIVLVASQIIFTTECYFAARMVADETASAG